MSSDSPKSHVAFVLNCPPDKVDMLEEMLGAFVEPECFLGSSRESWRDARYSPDEQTIRILPDDAPEAERLIIYIDGQCDAEAVVLRLVDNLRQYLDEIDPACDVRQVFCRPLALPAVDWAVLWREFFQPVRVSDRILVVPEWWDMAAVEKSGDFALPDDGVLLRMLPGQAFGSGTHPTTQLALRWLDRTVEPGMRMLDFGAGSGILSFAAALLGAQSIVAVEVDGESEENFHDNLALNPLPHACSGIDFRIGSSERVGGDERFELVVCNALFHRVSDHFETLAAHLVSGGQFLYSGYLREESDQVRNFFGGLGLVVEAEDALEEWGLMRLRK
ncbi:MAG: 50S ribosomal protein L11 methyltransferase [Candidatus Sumerlaeia bacterium]